MECLDICGSLIGNLPERKDTVSTVLDENYQAPAHVHVLCSGLKVENKKYVRSNLEHVKNSEYLNAGHLNNGNI